MIEIERKFIVKSEAFKLCASATIQIIQGYLNSDPERTVRVRLSNGEGKITIKGASHDNGLSRFEWEKNIKSCEAKALLALCLPNLIEKTRYIVEFKGYTFEVDEFLGVNKGLIIAEVELTSKNDGFEKPEWLGDEVTGNEKYYNSYLCRNPFTSWDN